MPRAASYPIFAGSGMRPLQSGHHLLEGGPKGTFEATPDNRIQGVIVARDFPYQTEDLWKD
jgi:hypothetical protein